MWEEQCANCGEWFNVTAFPDVIFGVSKGRISGPGEKSRTKMP